MEMVMIMKRILPALFVGLAFVGLLRLAGEAAAEPQPQDQQEVLKTMVQWNKDLGVTCDYCHTSDKTQTIESLEGKTASSRISRRFFTGGLPRTCRA